MRRRDLHERDGGYGFADHHRAVFIQHKGSQVPISSEEDPCPEDGAVQTRQGIVGTLCESPTKGGRSLH
jgi:hypothetical protein